MKDLWPARDHVLARVDQLQRLDPHRVIPRDVLRTLTFLRADGTESGVKFDADGAANQQTFRSVRRLSPRSAEALDALIEWEGAARASQVLAIIMRRRGSNGTLHGIGLLADGTVMSAEGRAEDPLGEYIGRVDPAAFADLAALAVSNGFFTLAEGDVPSSGRPAEVTVEVWTGARDTVVEAVAGSVPEPLRELAERLERLPTASTGLRWPSDGWRGTRVTVASPAVPVWPRPR